MPKGLSTTLQEWIRASLKIDQFSVTLLVTTAEVGNYFNLQAGNKSFWVLDASSSPNFIEQVITLIHIFEQQNLIPPKIIAKNLEAGFLLLSNFGTKTLFSELTHDNADHLYYSALKKLHLIQKIQVLNHLNSGQFTKHRLKIEFKTFCKNFLERFLEVTLTKHEKLLLENTFRLLIDNTKTQPQVFTHANYNTKNLFLLPQNKLGIWGFEQAMIGPITYDLVALLRDPYINWPVVQVTHWALQYYQTLIKDKMIKDNISVEQFLSWFDLTGVLYHFKTTAYFAALYLDDHNLDHVKNMPRTLNYIELIIKHYPKLKTFQQFFQKKILKEFYKKFRTLLHDDGGSEKTSWHSF